MFYLSKLLQTQSLKLVFLQEIWASYNQKSALNQIFPDFSIEISTPDMFTPPEDLLCDRDHTWHGSGIMWHDSLDPTVTVLKTINDRFTCIKLILHEKKFLVFSVYFPTSGKDDDYLDCIGDLVNFAMEHQDDDEVILIGTDSNCSERSTPRRILAFSNMCERLNLRKVSTNHPTFHHHNNLSESNIDYFLITENYASNLGEPTVSCSLETPENFSSHDPVTAILRVHGAELQPGGVYSHTYTDFTQHKVIWDPGKLHNYQEAAGTALATYSDMFHLPEHIPLKCELYSNLLVKAAELHMDLKPEKQHSRKMLKSPPIIHQAWVKLRSAYNTWKKEGKVKDTVSLSYQSLRQAKRHFQCIYRQQREYRHIRNNNTIMQADYRNKRQFYKTIKNIRGGKTSNTPGTLITPTGTYNGSDILEGFTADAELLGQHVGEAPEFDNSFYKLCILDNLYIFDFPGHDEIKIPEMRIEDLNNIVNKEMKLGKACDVYKLTVEHLRYAGTKAKQYILELINDIIKNIYYLTCPQVKKGLSTAAYKAKQKPKNKASSYRRITVTPQIGSILDRYIDPMAEDIFRTVQSSDQLGFTGNMSYLMAAVERGECQRHALDTKQTCFGVSFDGQAAFPSVDRNIQVRELYACGETGDLLKYSNNTYQNTVSHVKLDGKLGRQFVEYKGARQGHKRSAGHFKSYINPCLTSKNSSQLGYWIGPICVTCICITDDTYMAGIYQEVHPY